MGLLTQFAQSPDSYYEYAAPSTDLSSGESAALIAAMSAFFVLFLFLALIAYVVHAFLLSRIFKKAGVEQWIAWVPFYNTWKTLELGGQQGFWAILAIVPVVNIVAAIFLYIAMYNIGLKLQKEGWFVILAIFLPIVWMGWLAFDGSEWNEKGGAAPTAKKPVEA